MLRSFTLRHTPPPCDFPVPFYFVFCYCPCQQEWEGQAKTINRHWPTIVSDWSRDQVSEKHTTHATLNSVIQNVQSLKFIKIVIGAWSNGSHAGKNDRRERGRGGGAFFSSSFFLSVLFTPPPCPRFRFLLGGWGGGGGSSSSFFFSFYHCRCRELFHSGMQQIGGR